MRIDVYTPVLLSLLLTALCPAVGRRVAPPLAARVLTVSAVFCRAWPAAVRPPAPGRLLSR